ncbi:MAG TPA: hypothetical protein VM076_21535 [Gemmatimonadaceae bacterium]|nr:hypothetical protein [Gemmatimonadaceae bacterium]
MLRVAPRVASVGALALAVGCRGVPNAMGPDRASARTNSDAFFDGLAKRFDNVQRAPKFFQARSKLGRYALSPSGVYADTSVWTSSGADSTRTISLLGTHTATGYLFTPRASVPTPSVTGDARHVIRLKRRGESEFDWLTNVDHAIGSVRGSEVAAALTAFIGAPEQLGAARITGDNQALFPHTSRVLGELFALDTVRVSTLADRSTSVLVRFTMNPNRLRRTRPNFAKYLDKYVSPARYRIRLIDGRGATWLDAAGSDNAFTISYRVKNGELLALAGAARPIPDSLQIAVDMSAKFSIFRVGVTSLVGNFRFIRADNERGWMMRFRHEPDWHFPLAVNHFIQTSLRHPFRGEGITLRVSIRERSGSQSLLAREAGVAVQESGIVRWLGGLGSSAMSDFAGRAEVEENRYVYEVLSALRADFVAALSVGE